MEYEYWFANIQGLSNRQKREIRQKVFEAKEIYFMSEARLQKLGIEEKECGYIIEAQNQTSSLGQYEQMIKNHIHMIPVWHSEYPEKLKYISSVPYAIYVKGKLPNATGVTVAIVGARECSSYGKSMAYELGAVLGESGVQIISGMARGIDGAGQKGALDMEGTSFAVLGCGVDICYPREHIELYTRLSQNGGILSEQPPGTKPLPCYFPARNRLISALADVVVVVEAKEKSGSLITADMALEQGKDVYACPGPMTSLLSAGCHRLIKQGAGIIVSVADFMEELRISHSQFLANVTENKILLETAENLVYTRLGFTPQNSESLARDLNMSISEVFQILIRLELKGYIEEVSKNYYVRLK